ncbi:MAG TPA: septum formation initiator family protein, partial [Pyrinomonadaceae bacterium]|nr:septum formation initiator family protein [Pyrinomonadaceae bacterium]
TFEAAAPRAATRRRELALPSWVVFCMIMLATFAVCVTVTMRTHAGMRSAAQEYEQMSTDVEKIRSTNDSLRREVERLRTDPRAIEAAARERLNMLKANEVVVPLN